MKKSQIIVTIIALVVIVALLATVGYGYYKKATFVQQNPVATMEVEGFGTIKVELYPDQAPDTVTNFIKLANNGYYDGLTFHRIVKDFMIQGGDSAGDGTGSVTKDALFQDEDSTKYSITGEFLANGYKNTIKFEEGTIAMARADYTSYSSTLTTESYNSAGSQFFIMTKNNSSLNGYYAAFGKVTEGLDIVHKIEEVEVEPAEDENSEASTPVTAPVITSIKVETNGIDYGTPTTLTPFDYTSWLYSQYGVSQ